MNTIENNKLIAEFLGLETIVGTSIVSVVQHNQLKVFNPNNEWNWLMEVIEVIKQKYCFVNINISTDETSISIFDIEGKNHFTTCPKNNYEGANMLSVTYKAVVNFIEWSNEQNS